MHSMVMKIVVNKRILLLEELLIGGFHYTILKFQNETSFQRLYRVIGYADSEYDIVTIYDI